MRLTSSLAASFSLLVLAGCQSDNGAKASDGASPASTPASTPADDKEVVAADIKVPPLPAGIDEAGLKARIARYATPTLTADVSHLPESEKQALALIIEAARDLDPVFDRQAWRQNPAVTFSLAKDAKEGDTLAAERLRYLRLMRGPWDRQDHHNAVAADVPYPAGAGFYPPDLTKEEFEAYVAKHPKQRAELESLTTLVHRNPAGLLITTPYRVAFKAWLEPAAKKLEAAAAATQNASLKKFLLSRAEAFRTDDYYQSDKDWMDLDSAVEVTIAPYEIYEDKLLGLKASYEAFVTVADPKASADLAKYKAYLPAMEKNLPIPDTMKTVRGGESPIRVVDLVFTSGDARKSVQTIAFNLPNDERVRKEKGAKKVMLRNAIETKFETIMRPIANEILDEKQLPFLSSEAFFNEVLFHELSHSLGPAFTERTNADGSKEKVEVRVALGSNYSAIEECKADAMGAYNILFLIDKGEFDKSFREKLLVSYFAGLFRSVRFGVAEAHGKGAAVQINRYLESGAATFDEKTGRFSVNLKKLEAANRDLVRDLCVLEDAGDAKKAEAFLSKYGVMSAPMKQALGKVDSVPLDIRPIFPLAGESGDPLTLRDR